MHIKKKKNKRCRIQIQIKKYDFFKNNNFFQFFSIIFSKRVPLVLVKNSFFQFFKIFKNLQKIGLNGTYKYVQRNKVMQFELIWSVHWKVTRDLWGCLQNLPIPSWNRVNPSGSDIYSLHWSPRGGEISPPPLNQGRCKCSKLTVQKSLSL